MGITIKQRDRVMMKTMATHIAMRFEVSREIDTYENTIAFYANVQPELRELHPLESYLNELICLYSYSREARLDDIHYNSEQRMIMERCYAEAIRNVYQLFKEEFTRYFPECNIDKYPISISAKAALEDNDTPRLSRVEIPTPKEVYREQKRKAVKELKESHPKLEEIYLLAEHVIAYEDCYFHLSDENIELVRLVRALSIVENSDSPKKAELGQYIVDTLKAKLSDEVYIKNPNNEYVKELIKTAVGNPTDPGSPIVERSERVEMALNKAITSPTHKLIDN